jgi:hypothetical protein
MLCENQNPLGIPCQLEKGHDNSHACKYGCDHTWINIKMPPRPQAKIVLLALTSLMDANLTMEQRDEIIEEALNTAGILTTTLNYAEARAVIRVLGEKLNYEFDKVSIIDNNF